MSAARSIVLCLEKEKLIRAYSWAVSEYNRMSSAQVVAVKNGDGPMFNEQIASAGLRMDRAKYAVIKHIEEHGC